MAGWSYRLGRMAGPKVRKAKWVWQSVFGSEADLLAAERAVGRDLSLEILRSVKRSADGTAQAWIDRIGSRLVPYLKEKRIAFSFIAIEESQLNAFALPGGFVFVTSSLLDFCHREDDSVAFILAHEMAHIVKKHAMERLVMQSAVSFASNLPLFRQAVSSWIRRAGTSALQSSYSQDHELEADALAVALCRATGFAPDGGIKLLSRLARDNNDPQAGPLNPYFSTHPSLSTRIAQIRRIIHDG